MTPINSQGTQVFVMSVPTTEWADCAAARTAILAGKQVLCPQSLGALEQTRSVTEYKCLSSNDSTKIAGAISRGASDVGMLFDPTDVAGQAEMVTAFEANTPLRVGVIYPASGTDTKGALRYFDGIVTKEAETVEMDTAILYEVTIDVASSITKCTQEA